jgi:hypothetical protein
MMILAEGGTGATPGALPRCRRCATVSAEPISDAALGVHVLSASADVGFVNLHLILRGTADLLEGLGLHGLTDAVEHVPCRLLSDADGAGHFVRANAILAVRQHPNRLCDCQHRFHFKESELNSGYAEGDDIFLVVDGDRVAGRTQVFNGDIGRLGEALYDGLDGKLALTFPYDDPDLHEKLFVMTEHNLRSSFAEPRKRGTFEARIMGGITPGDVLRIFVRQDASLGKIDYALQLFYLATAERALNNQ